MSWWRWDAARCAEAFVDLSAEACSVVCGHTQMPFVRLVDRRLVVYRAA